MVSGDFSQTAKAVRKMVSTGEAQENVGLARTG